MPANDPERIIYNSDTVYSTTIFRPVSLSPSTIPEAESHPPQRTRRLETPLHFEGGLFSDIRSSDGKLLSKVTVDRVHSSMRRDVIDSPSTSETIGSHGNKDYVDDIIKTETITNEDVIKVKFTPIPLELDGPSLVPKLAINRALTPIQLINNDYEDLQSYKIVNSLLKESWSEKTCSDFRGKSVDHIGVEVDEPFKRSHSPLANFLVPEHLTKIDNYLEESLKICSEVTVKDDLKQLELDEVRETNLLHEKTTKHDEERTQISDKNENNVTSIYRDDDEKINSYVEEFIATSTLNDEYSKCNKIKLNSVIEKHPGVLTAIYNMPMHYHAAILCFFLIVYNLVYQYIKQNCYGSKK